MDTIITHSPCANNYYQYGTDKWTLQTRGVTTWNLNNEYTVPPILMPNGQANDSATLIFTNTMPKCYAPDTTGTGRDTCNIVFNAWRTGSDSTSETIKLEYYLRVNNQNTFVGECYLSGVAQHGATQAFDLGNTAVTQYKDPGENTFIIHNASTSTIQLDHVKIYRTYKMCHTGCVNGENGCQCPICGGGYTICSGGHPYGTNGSFDATRIDTPCNSLTCGGLSYTQWHDTSKLGETLLSSGRNILSWTFDFSTLSHGHTGKSICLFNFNYIKPESTSDANDIEIVALLNGYTINNYYLSKYGDKGLYPSYDLAQAPSGASYDDTGLNIVSLKNVGSTNVLMDDSSGGGIDIYRIYQSTPICDYPCQSGQTECPTCECGCETCQSACQVSCQSCYFCEFCATPCYSCYIACQEACEVECQGCQTGCEVTCQTGCEVSCQTGCQVNCQTGCEVACQNCQTGCEVACQTGCELACQTCEGFCEPQCYACETCYTCVGTCQTCQTPCEWSCQNCQTGCEISCQESCQLSCQETCQVSCQTCYTTCQSGCEVACQTCEGGCEPSCYACETCYTCIASCQTGCEASCQTGCQITCQTGCQVSCQTGCQVSCQTGCQVTCQNCQTGCEVGCQQGEGWCEPYCYACQSCMTCQGCQASCQTCQTGCQVSCQETCQLSCQGCYGCYTCQACEAGCQQGEGGCEPYCYACQSCMTCQSGQS